MIVVVKTETGKVVEVTEDKLDENRDAALLVVVGTDEPFKATTKVSLNTPEVGDTVCTWSGYHRKHTCGTVKHVATNRVYIYMTVIPGDSGSLLYNSNGEVVGIVVAYMKNASPAIGVATLSSQWGYMLPEPEAMDLMDDPALGP
jgi:V8-like Glu-specific endopeptidase